MRIIGIIIIIVVLGFFGGYGIMHSQLDNSIGSKEAKNIIPMDNKTEQQLQESPNNLKVEKSGTISKEQAETIVLDNADIQAKDISKLKTKIENYYGKDIYDIEFYADNKKYDYNVDMYGGEILAMDYEIDKKYYAKLKGKSIDEEEAKALVVAQIPNVDAQSIRLNLEHDDDYLQYEGMVQVDGILYEFTIDKNTGTFVEWKWKKNK
ncbi:PepSY domain-containing protein [uncultured Megamonas sp.]|uniref:PepSY domain-containing protein n=1 Tax=uncultured Megamonas sp. TaxID=286140 RepID=UPI00266EEB73|nr:PepSY domain-containing protein [uncultured Megamonas sp.]